MWAQLISMRLKAGKEGDLPRLYEQLRAAEQPDTGLLRTIDLRDDKDPHRIYNIVLFESEDQARQRERDPRREEESEGGPGDDGRDLRRPSRVRRPDRPRRHVVLSGATQSRGSRSASRGHPAFRRASVTSRSDIEAQAPRYQGDSRLDECVISHLGL